MTPRIEEASGGSREWNCVCGNSPCDGLDCGVWLPGKRPRKIAAKKSPEELAAIRARAWATRRAHQINDSKEQGHG